MAGGAPIYISNFGNIPGSVSAQYTNLDTVTISRADTGGIWNHLRQYPADLTWVKDINQNVYQFSAGYAILMTSGSATNIVDYVALTAHNPSPPWNHVK